MEKNPKGKNAPVSAVVTVAIVAILWNEEASCVNYRYLQHNIPKCVFALAFEHTSHAPRTLLHYALHAMHIALLSLGKREAQILTRAQSNFTLIPTRR